MPEPAVFTVTRDQLIEAIGDATPLDLTGDNVDPEATLADAILSQLTPAADAREAAQAWLRTGLRDSAAEYRSRTIKAPTDADGAIMLMVSSELDKLADLLDAVPPAAGTVADDRLAVEQVIWRAVLAEHYLMDVVCDPETKTDNPVCGCSRVFLGWHPSIGAARQAWIDHVADAVTLRRGPGNAPVSDHDLWHAGFAAGRSAGHAGEAGTAGTGEAS
jgi:hypothetical protein